jgi:hypothetical protein
VCPEIQSERLPSAHIKSDALYRTADVIEMS